MIEVLGSDRDKLKSLLDREPIRYAGSIHRVCGENRNDHRVYVDDPDNPLAILTVAVREDTGLSIVGFDDDAVRNLLADLEVKKGLFHSVESRIVPIIEELFDIDYKGECWLYVPAKPIEDEVGYEMTDLQPDDAPIVAKYWELGDYDEEFLRGKIKTGISAAIRLDGELVAWAGTYFKTDKACHMGFLHVKEEHRRKGLARAVSIGLCRKIQDAGLVPYAYLFKDNEASIALAEGMGFERIGEGTWVGIAGRRHP